MSKFLMKANLIVGIATALVSIFTYLEGNIVWGTYFAVLSILNLVYAGVWYREEYITTVTTEKVRHE
jgi:hypothetical protein